MQKRGNGEGSIRKRKDGRYEVRITGTSNGKAFRISRYAHTQEEATQLLHTLSVIMMQTPQYFKDTITLAEWLDNWLEVYMRPVLKQSTYMSYETYARVHFKPALGQVRLQDITSRMLQEFYNYKLMHEQLSPKSIINMNLYLHKALSQAMAEGLILSNPASSLNLPRGTKPQIQVLTRDQQARLISASYQHRYGVFIRLVLATGLRVGELLGLRWQDIDTAAHMLYVRQTLGRYKRYDCEEDDDIHTEIVIQTPKSQNSIRSIPILPQLFQELMLWKQVQAQDQMNAGSRYVFSGMVVTNEIGGYIEPRTFREYYHQILELAGLPHFTFHALRHTFATRAMEQGMDPKTLSILLGHYSVAFTLDTYAHVLDSQKWEAMKTMEALYMGAGQIG